MEVLCTRTITQCTLPPLQTPHITQGAAQDIFHIRCYCRRPQGIQKQRRLPLSSNPEICCCDAVLFCLQGPKKSRGEIEIKEVQAPKQRIELRSTEHHPEYEIWQSWLKQDDPVPGGSCRHPHFFILQRGSQSKKWNGWSKPKIEPEATDFNASASTASSLYFPDIFLYPSSSHCFAVLYTRIFVSSLICSCPGRQYGARRRARWEGAYRIRLGLQQNFSLLHPAPPLMCLLSQSLSLGPSLFPYPNGGRAMMVTSLCETNKKHYMQTCIW